MAEATSWRFPGYTLVSRANASTKWREQSALRSADLGGAADRQLSGNNSREAQVVGKAALDPKRPSRGKRLAIFANVVKHILSWPRRPRFNGNQQD